LQAPKTFKLMKLKLFLMLWIIYFKTWC